MDEFVAGWDGGGTKTAVCCMNLAGVVLECKSFGALNVNGAGAATVAQTSAEIMAWLTSLESRFGACRSLCIGTAGLSNPLAVQSIAGAVQSAGFTGALRIVGDQETALRGAVGEVGAVLIAGTGSICFGKNTRGETARSGGYGYLIDDEGSGYAIGRDILSAVVRAKDGRIPSTILTRCVFEQLQISDIETLIAFVYSQTREKREIAALAPLLLKGLACGDSACARIAGKAADELALLLCAVLNSLRVTQGEISFLGSILENFETIALGVCDRVHAAFPKIRRIAPRQDAAAGAALIALDLMGTEGVGGIK